MPNSKPLPIMNAYSSPRPIRLQTISNKQISAQFDTTAPPSIRQGSSVNQSAALQVRWRAERELLPARRSRAKPQAAKNFPLLAHKRVWLFLVTLPITPLPAMLHLVVGHGIMRRTYRSITWSGTVATSAEAGAIGGLALSPLLLGLPLALYPFQRDYGAGEDFFDDETTDGRMAMWKQLRRYAAYALGAVFVVGDGALAGSLGVACIRAADGTMDAMFTPGQIFVVGLLGGMVVCGGLFILASFALCIWLGISFAR